MADDPLPTKQREKIAALWRSGKNAREISELLPCSMNIIYKYRPKSVKLRQDKDRLARLHVESKPFFLRGEIKPLR